MGMTDILLIIMAMIAMLFIVLIVAVVMLFKRIETLEADEESIRDLVITMTNDLRHDIGKSLGDLNELIGEYNKTLDKLTDLMTGYDEAVNRIETSTFDFKKLVASYAAEVYDFGQDMRKQMDSLGNSQMKILESMATVFHKIPPTAAKDIFEGGKLNDNPEQGEAEGYSDEADSTSTPVDSL